MGVFYKIFKINELIYGASGTGYITPFIRTKSILVNCKKKKRHLIISPIILY